MKWLPKGGGAGFSGGWRGFAIDQVSPTLPVLLSPQEPWSPPGWGLLHVCQSRCVSSHNGAESMQHFVCQVAEQMYLKLYGLKVFHSLLQHAAVR